LRVRQTKVQTKVQTASPKLAIERAGGAMGRGDGKGRWEGKTGWDRLAPCRRKPEGDTSFWNNCTSIVLSTAAGGSSVPRLFRGPLQVQVQVDGSLAWPNAPQKSAAGLTAWLRYPHGPCSCNAMTALPPPHGQHNLAAPNPVHRSSSCGTSVRFRTPDGSHPTRTPRGIRKVSHQVPSQVGHFSQRHRRKQPQPKEGASRDLSCSRSRPDRSPTISRCSPAAHLLPSHALPCSTQLVFLLTRFLAPHNWS
jgi:hypothetical protein